MLLGLAVETNIFHFRDTGQYLTWKHFNTSPVCWHTTCLALRIRNMTATTPHPTAVTSWHISSYTYVRISLANTCSSGLHVPG